VKRPQQQPVTRGGRPAPDDLVALREATRAAHEVLRDLRQERRAVEQLLAGLTDQVQRAVEARVEEALTRDLAKLGEATDKAMRASVAKVTREFDRLEAIMLGREKGAKHGPLEDLIRRHVATHPEVTP
jgi:hypothetical protein